MPVSKTSYWLTLTTAVIALAVGAGFVLRHTNAPSDGARLEPGDNGITPSGVRIAPLIAAPGGLQKGDLVTAVEGVRMNEWARSLFGGPALSFARETITYTVERDGQTIQVPVSLGRYPLGAIIRSNWGTIAFALVSLLVTTFVFIRRPDDPAGRVLFLSAACLTSSTAWSFGLTVSDLTDGLGFWLYKLATLIFFDLYWTAGLHFALIFPRPLAGASRRRWLIPAIYIIPYLGLFLFLLSIRPASSGPLEWFSRWTVAEGVHGVVFLAAVTITFAIQYRMNAAGVMRQKIRWVIFAGLISGGGGLVFYLLPPLLGLPSVSSNMAGLLALPFPIAIAIAILRDNLFDIDTLVNRALVYGALTAGTMTLYVVVVGTLGDLLQARDRTLLAFLTTGLVAILFHPFREQLQRSVNRLMYGERDDPYAVLASLSRRLEGALQPGAVFPTITETVAEALKLPYAAITLYDRSEGSVRTIAAYGLDKSSVVRLPLAHQGVWIGELVVGQRAPGEAFTPGEQRLLEDIARQAGAAVHTVGLNADLQRSRERLVLAREEERRRIRRDLHDGLGPTLAGLALELDAARNQLHQDLPAAESLLLDLKAQTVAAIEDIRRLVDNLRPPVLDELGLSFAIQEYAANRSGEKLQVRVEVHNPPALLPAAVEVATYRIVCEAINNVARHAQARECLVRLAFEGEVRIEVSDDGVGLPNPGRERLGVGLSSMRERAEELGGSCVVGVQKEGGTYVLARLPLGGFSAAAPLAEEEKEDG